MNFVDIKQVNHENQINGLAFEGKGRPGFRSVHIMEIANARTRNKRLSEVFVSIC